MYQLTIVIKTTNSSNSHYLKEFIIFVINKVNLTSQMSVQTDNYIIYVHLYINSVFVFVYVDRV